jgi:uncharacterized membrane protein
MEITLLVIIILLLFFKLTKINDQLEKLQLNVEDLKKALKKLTVEKPEAKVPNSVIRNNDLVIEKKEEVLFTPITKEIKIDEPKEKIAEESQKTAFKEEIKVPIAVKKSYWEIFREKNPDMEKFVGENLISKIGVLILVLGISYFVKYAIDKNWINETARVGIGILCGAIVMGFAHKLRSNYKAFSSVLVAGAISIFYFTIAIAFHQYHIFSQSVAFVLMVIITAFSVFVSVSYDRMELAILSLIGGFSVPFILSTGQGNHIVLFTYIAILDLGVLAIAYLKRWSLVNILVFVFTIILYASWLGTKYEDMPEKTNLSAFLFATLYYIIFMITNTINNMRTKGLFSRIELAVLISNTFFYFSCGMIILSNENLELKGLFTISLALFNFISAWFLYKKFGLDKNAIYILIGLTLTLVTLSIPLQFKGNYITLFWAAEAVLLLWLSKKSEISQFRFASVIVHFLMTISLFLDWLSVYSANTEIATVILNKGFIAGVFATCSFVATGFLLKNETKKYELFGLVIDSISHRTISMILSMISIYFTGFFESLYQSNQFFSGNYSPKSITIAYHLIFVATTVFFLQKKKNALPQNLIAAFLLINIVLYVLYFSSIPFGEFKETLDLISTTKIAFFIHYVSLLCICYLTFITRKYFDTNELFPTFKRQWIIWFFAFLVVFLASNEVMLHGTIFFSDPAYLENKNPHLIYQNYDTVHTLILKVAFPILWGVIAFVLLTIGIKNQNKELRIFSLTLLAITIVKLFFYDISNVSETGKIIAFILLGITILVMSFAYQKIRKIVLESENPQEIEKNES